MIDVFCSDCRLKLLFFCMKTNNYDKYLNLKNFAFEITKVNGGFKKLALVSYTDDYRLYMVIRDLFMLMYAMTRHLGGYETH